jgi:hypothetical protein
MVSDSAALVLFAIRSALKLSQQLRMAYVENTRRRELVLPLPNFFASPDVVSATNYFAGPGARHVAASGRLAALLHKQKQPGEVLIESEQSELCACHAEFFNVDLAQSGRLGQTSDGSSLSADELNALITIRQWRRGTDPNPPVVQRLAGTFVELGIDYFLNVPGALNNNSTHSKVVAGFLDAMSGINFTEEQLRDLPTRLFVASVETVSAHPEWLTGDASAQELVRVATHAVSVNAAKRLEQLQAGGNSDLVKEQHVLDWAALVFRSVLSSAGPLVLSEPKRFLGIRSDAGSALITQVSDAVLGLILDQDTFEPERLFSAKGLEKISQAALAVLGDHPEILNNAALQKLLVEITRQVGQFDTQLAPDIFPELARLILNETGEHLALLWPDFSGRPEHHLLLTAVSVTLQIVTRPADAAAKWSLQFSRADLLAIVSAVINEVTANPNWLLSKAVKEADDVRAALSATIAVLRSRADQRLSTSTAVEILAETIRAVGLRQEFLDLLPQSIPPVGQPIIAAALETMLAAAFKHPPEASAAWQLVRAEALVEMVRIGLEQLAGSRLRPELMPVFAGAINQQIDAVARGHRWDPAAYEAALLAALAA